MITRSRAAAECSLAAAESTKPQSSEYSRGQNRGSELVVKKLQKKNEVLRDELTKTKECLHWYVKHEGKYYAKLEEVRVLLEFEKKRHAEIETNLRAKIEELSQKLIISLETSQQETIKHREEYRKEVDYLRDELQQVRVDRDRQLEHIQHMNVELKKYEELKGKSK